MTKPEIGAIYPALPAIFTVAATLIIWKISILFFDISPFILPPPETVFERLWILLRERNFWSVHVVTTLWEILAGFFLALVAGLTTGVLFGKLPWLERALKPALLTLQVVPKITLLPILIIWTGFGMTSKIIFAAILSFFPIMLNVLLGLKSVSPGHQEVMRAFHAGRWSMFRFVELYSVLPYLIAGMEVGIVFAVIGAIVGEYLSGSEGLGYLAVIALGSLDMPRLFAVLIVLTLLSYALAMLVHCVKQVLIPWHDSMR
ncbi:MAG: ABC transporter permease [Pseudomonadales bacterium]|jgi:NitT/TauT family transport system permease protein|nr:ABC transporter permease [Pseudomonadales bacterium]